jgi:hypothetical protein
MLNWFRRRGLSPEARRRMMIVAARSEEALIETHVDNAVELLEALGDEVDLDRGIELYEEALGLPPQLADAVKTRVLARIESPAPAGSIFRGVFSGEGAGSARTARARPRRRPR